MFKYILDSAYDCRFMPSISYNIISDELYIRYMWLYYYVYTEKYDRIMMGENASYMKDGSVYIGNCGSSTYQYSNRYATHLRKILFNDVDRSLIHKCKPHWEFHYRYAEEYEYLKDKFPQLQKELDSKFNLKYNTKPKYDW
jgi:hypothetical protein